MTTATLTKTLTGGVELYSSKTLDVQSALAQFKEQNTFSITAELVDGEFCGDHDDPASKLWCFKLELAELALSLSLIHI